ncbi:hypothetical protein PV08_06963 [Exophiala spinifera]|uniref:Uncharacterized protein n=1 Tax=Exophiala spinifera TaxID=91928 RepID=A0A0D1ZMX7_9EURO|nr:uncharacterized protein PV08_06963 [Exophiala spinifera]KIW14182.1 hypothetical protein PV08_06963 [Exophiala spinifera]
MAPKTLRARSSNERPATSHPTVPISGLRDVSETSKGKASAKPEAAIAVYKTKGVGGIHLLGIGGQFDNYVLTTSDGNRRPRRMVAATSQTSRT